MLLESFLIPLAVSVIGTFLTYISVDSKNTFDSEKREILSYFDDMEGDCLNYWSTDGRQVDLERQIRKSFFRTQAQLRRLTEGSKSHIQMNIWLGELFQSMTGGDFESDERLASDERASRSRDVIEKIRYRLAELGWLSLRIQQTFKRRGRG